jgi:hypothetical protein
MGMSLQSRTRRAVASCALALLFTTGLFASGPAETGKNGISYQHYVDRDEPWSIHIIRIDRARREYELGTALGGGTRIGLGSLTQQLRRIPKQLGSPVAAINGDFFERGGSYAGDPRGLQIVRGELVSSPTGQACLWVDTNGNPHIDAVKPNFAVTWPNGEQTAFRLNEERAQDTVLYTPACPRSTQTSGGTEFVLEAVDSSKWLPLRAGEKYTARIREIRRGGNSPIPPGTMVLSMGRIRGGSGAATAVEGDVIAVSTETTPSLRGASSAIGGGPALLHESKVLTPRASKARERHPRSAVGWNKKNIFLVEVDGRQRFSDGMTLPELAEFMLKLQCEEAINLDGGGSSEIWLNGKIMNSPCEGGERSTGNSLVVIEKSGQAQP